MRWGNQLDDVTERSACSNRCKLCKSVFFNLNALSGATDSQDLDDLVKRVGQSSDNEKTIKEIDWNAMG